MDYTFLSKEEQISGLKNRIHQLEQEHFTNSLLVEECQLVGDDVSLPEFEVAVQSAEPRIEYLKAQLKALENDDERTE